MNTVDEKLTFYPKEHTDLVLKAISLATKGHNDSNHLYGDVSYTIHLSHVVDVAYRFIDLIPVGFRPNVIAGCWLHDSIEDARLSYNDVKKALNSIIVAEIVFAVTNEKGRNRKERANDNYYKGIRETEGATFVKLCDRIANIEFKGKADMYAKEHPYFREQLYTEDYKPMFDYIDHLLYGASSN